MIDSAKIYRMENRLHCGPTGRGHARAGAREQDAFLLHPPDRVPRLRRDRRNPLKNPIDVYIACWEWGKYLGDEALAEGVDVCVSSWTRMAPNTLPALAKAGANYMNSQLIKMEAHHQRLHRRHRARYRGLRQRGLGREHFRGARRQDPHAAAGRVRAARHHARQRSCTLAQRSGHSGGRDASFRARCCTSPTKCSSPARRPRSRPSVPSTGSQIGKGRRGPVAERLQKEFFAIVDGTQPDRTAGCRRSYSRRRSQSSRSRVRKAARPAWPPPPRFAIRPRSHLMDSLFCSASARRNARQNSSPGFAFQQVFS